MTTPQTPSFSPKEEIIAMESQFTPKQKEAFNLHYQRHLYQQKVLQTLYFKEVFEDNTKFIKHRNLCHSSCYNRIDSQELASMQDPQMADSTLSNLSQCLTQCDKPWKDADTYVDNIDFLSWRKLEGCSEGCDIDRAQTGGEGRYFPCLWDCYNRLDRRYRGYWTNHKNKIEERYFGDKL